MNSPVICLRDVDLGYDRRPILQHVSFAVERGEFLALLGPNGAGKTTLLRGVLGLIPMLAGTIEYGFDRLASPPGYVPQRETLDPIFPLTAFEVVLMGTYARLAPLRPVGRRQRVKATACLDEVGLLHVASQPFWALSGGQKQRVLIARARGGSRGSSPRRADSRRRRRRRTDHPRPDLAAEPREDADGRIGLPSLAARPVARAYRDL